jgi:hypothetical protein
MWLSTLLSGGRNGLLFALLALVLVPAASAAGEVGVELEAWRVVSQLDGSERLEAADQARPGDVIEYRARFTNHTGVTVLGLKGLIPIPAETEYLVASANPAAVEASTNGDSFSPVPLLRPVRQEDGTERWEAVPLVEYRFLRWTVAELAEDEEAVVSARVRIPAAAEGRTSP